jgi:hypothetical protein
MPGVRPRSDRLGSVVGGGEMSLLHYQSHLSTVPEHNVTAAAIRVKEEEEGEEEEEEEVVLLMNSEKNNNSQLTTVSHFVTEVNMRRPHNNSSGFLFIYF